MKFFSQIHKKAWPFFFLILILFFPRAACAQNVLHFPDTNLEQAIREELGQPGGLITRADLRRLVSLDASRREIKDLSGLEYALRLETLNLYQNQIGDLSALQGLTTVKALYLGANEISDLAPLEKMSRLEVLHLEHNPLRHIGPLQKLRRLTELRLDNTLVEDLLVLGNLNRLEILHLDGVTAELSSLKKLTRLQQLSLSGCGLEDLSFLEHFPGLTRLDLGDNKLEFVSPLANLKRLEWLSLENNRIAEIAPLSALPGLAFLNLRGNRLDDIGSLLPLLSPQWVDLRANYLYLAPGSPEMEVIASLQGKGAQVVFELQKLPLYRGNGLVEAAPGSGGKLLRTPLKNWFAIMNPGLGWRIRSVTVSHGEGKPLDTIVEIGRRAPRGESYWNRLVGEPINVEEKLPHTFLMRGNSDTNLGMGVQIWPGYARDEGRFFYFSEVLLENISTGDEYLVELEPGSAGNYVGIELLPPEEKVREVVGRAELQRVLNTALQAREPTLNVKISLPRGTDIESELENIFENIYEADDYLRYSLQRKVLEWSRRDGETFINFRFYYHATREEEKIVDERVQEILREIITPQMDAHLATRAIHDFVVGHVAYDQSRRAHSAYAALVQGEAVCQGYALLLYKMLRQAGVEARIISGQAGGENHVWNLVCLDGKWYHLDATWNDPIPDVAGRVLHDYYNRTAAQMRPTHAWDEGAYPAAITPYAN